MLIRRLLSPIRTAVALCAVVLSSGVAAGDEKTRPARFAGSWYPGDAGALTKLVDDLLERARPSKLPSAPIAVISPHAGYRYSAPAAAAGFASLKSHTYERVIVLAFSHRHAGSYACVRRYGQPKLEATKVIDPTRPSKNDQYPEPSLRKLGLRIRSRW